MYTKINTTLLLCILFCFIFLTDIIAQEDEKEKEKIDDLIEMSLVFGEMKMALKSPA